MCYWNVHSRDSSPEKYIRKATNQTINLADTTDATKRLRFWLGAVVAWTKGLSSPSPWFVFSLSFLFRFPRLAFFSVAWRMLWMIVKCDLHTNILSICIHTFNFQTCSSSGGGDTTFIDGITSATSLSLSSSDITRIKSTRPTPDDQTTTNMTSPGISSWVLAYCRLKVLGYFGQWWFRLQAKLFRAVVWFNWCGLACVLYTRISTYTTGVNNMPSCTRRYY